MCAGRKTVETVLVSVPSLFTAINRGVNEKVLLTAFKLFIQLHTALTHKNRKELTLMSSTNESLINQGATIQKWSTLIKAHKFLLALTCINLIAAGIVLLRSAEDKSVMADSQSVPKVIRAQAIELVSEQGQVRSRLNVEQGGEVVFRLLDKNGTIRVKLGAGEDGSGLLLLDEATEPAVHMLARGKATAARPNTTGITLKGGDGQQRVIKP
jgi:hypothetical protein